MSGAGSSRYVFGVYVSGQRVGPKYLERRHAIAAAAELRRPPRRRGFLGFLAGPERGPARRPAVRVRRILDR